jgi:hypothetical protein
LRFYLWIFSFGYCSVEWSYVRTEVIDWWKSNWILHNFNVMQSLNIGGSWMTRLGMNNFFMKWEHDLFSLPEGWNLFGFVCMFDFNISPETYCLFRNIRIKKFTVKYCSRFYSSLICEWSWNMSDHILWKFDHFQNNNHYHNSWNSFIMISNAQYRASQIIKRKKDSMHSWSYLFYIVSASCLPVLNNLLELFDNPPIHEILKDSQ